MENNKLNPTTFGVQRGETASAALAVMALEILIFLFIIPIYQYRGNCKQMLM